MSPKNYTHRGKYSSFYSYEGPGIDYSVQDRCLSCMERDPDKVRGRLVWCVKHKRFTRTDPFCGDYDTVSPPS